MSGSVANAALLLMLSFSLPLNLRQRKLHGVSHTHNSSGRAITSQLGKLETGL